MNTHDYQTSHSAHRPGGTAGTRSLRRTETGAELVTDTPGVPEQHQPSRPRPHRTVDRTISTTCQIHGARGFCNLRVTRRADGGIVLDPHVGGACVLTLDELASAELRNLLIEWQG